MPGAGAYRRGHPDIAIPRDAVPWTQGFSGIAIKGMRPGAQDCGHPKGRSENTTSKLQL
jgi:hypothetical protein